MIENMNETNETVETKPVVPDFLKDLFQDTSLRTAARVRLTRELEELTRNREAVEKRKLAAEQELAAIDKRLAQLNGFMGEVNAAEPPPPSRRSVSAQTQGEATKSEILAALKRAGSKGMTLGSLRWAVGNKRTKAAVTKLRREGRVLIPEKQAVGGQGLIIRLR